MSNDQFTNPFVRQAIEEVDGWGAAGLTVENVLPLGRRVRVGGPNGPEALYFRTSLNADQIEMIVQSPTKEEVELVRARCSPDTKLRYPYSRVLAPLVQVRTPQDLGAVRDVLTARAKAAKG